MKKTIIKVSSVMLAVILTFTVAPLSGLMGFELPEWLDLSIDVSAASYSGTSGDIQWTFYESTGTAIISNNNDWFDWTDVTLSDFNDKIKIIEIRDGVKRIDKNAFSGFTSLESVMIPTSVTVINEGAFYNCSSLTDVYYSGTKQEWNNITIGNGNESLLNATIHFNDEPDCLIGDVNEDGKINTLDRVALTRYIAKWDEYPEGSINVEAADVNGDGNVNTLDRVVLTRYIAKWEGYETLPYNG